MNKNTIEIKITSCVISRCSDGLNALIVAARGDDVKMFSACERHYAGVNKAVMAKFLPQDYMVACYTEIFK